MGKVSYEFNVYWMQTDGVHNHTIVEAPCMSEAIQYVEGKGKCSYVFKAEMRCPITVGEY